MRVSIPSISKDVHPPTSDWSRILGRICNVPKRPAGASPVRAASSSQRPLELSQPAADVGQIHRTVAEN